MKVNPAHSCITVSEWRRPPSLEPALILPTGLSWQHHTPDQDQLLFEDKAKLANSPALEWLLGVSGAKSCGWELPFAFCGALVSAWHSDSALRQSLRCNVPVDHMCGAFFQINTTFL